MDTEPQNIEKIRTKIGEILAKYLSRTTEVNQFGLQESLVDFLTADRKEGHREVIKKLKKLKKEDRNPQWKWIIAEAILALSPGKCEHIKALEINGVETQIRREISEITGEDAPQGLVIKLTSYIIEKLKKA